MELEQVEHYDIEALKKYLLMSLAAIALWKISPILGATLLLSLVITSVMWQRPMDLVFWILFLTYTSIGNNNFLGGNTISVILSRATMLFLAILLAGKWKESGNASRLVTPFWGIFLYLVWEALVSLQGFNPLISYLKLFLFCCIFLALLGMANVVNHSVKTDDKLLRSAILAIISLIVIGSILLVPFPSIGQMTGYAAIQALQSGRGVSLFQGMTSHSQALGPLVAVMGTLLFADLSFTLKKWDKFYILLMLFCPFLIYKSSSRTALGTLVAGLGMVGFLTIHGKGLANHWKGKLLMVFNMLVVIAAIVVCVMPSIRWKIVNFTFKANEQTQLAEFSLHRMFSSRQDLIDESVRNFKANPIMGNGFQVSADMLEMQHSGLRSYLTAPIEKGVWIYAVPEEGGIIGMALFCCWLFVLFNLLIVRQAYIGASVFFAFLISNLGEFTLFAMSGIGGLYWALIFAALCLDLQRMKAADSMDINI